jgi:diguanylate cyclase
MNIEQGNLPSLLTRTLPIQVLLIEDNAEEAKSVTEILENDSGSEMMVWPVQNLWQGKELLKKESIDIVLLDLSQPDNQSFESLESILESSPDIPIVILSERDNPEYALQSIHMGAQDYLVKGHFEFELLKRSLYYAIERKQLLLQLQKVALFDALTQLPSRTLLIERLERTIERSQRESDFLFACFFLDLNGFKAVNDHYGHKLGDAVLIEAGQRLSQCVRTMDTVSRFGGDKFCVLLDGIAQQSDLDLVIDRIQTRFKAPFMFKNLSLEISISLGCTFNQFSEAHVETILERADQAMYQSKKTIQRHKQNILLRLLNFLKHH